MHPLKYQIMPGCPIDAPIKAPHYAGDVGYDLGAAITDDIIWLAPHEFTDIPTYVKVEIPDGFWGDVRARSSTYAKRKLIVMHSTIDNGYRGMMSILIFNPNPARVPIHRGDYLAQLVLLPRSTPELQQVDEISQTTRGEKGFGSSGGYHEPTNVVADRTYQCTCTQFSWSAKTWSNDCEVGKMFGPHIYRGRTNGFGKAI